MSGQFATALTSVGVAPGDRVVVQVGKSPAAVGLYLGVLRMGAIFVPLNTAYTAREVEYFLADTEAKVFVCRPESRGMADDVALQKHGGVLAGLAHGVHGPDHGVVLLFNRAAERGLKDVENAHSGLLFGRDYEHVVGLTDPLD